MRLSPTKVLLTVSPFRSFLFPPASVFSQRPLTRQPNFYAAWPSSAFSADCRLFVSLCSLFRPRFLCFHELADSFAKIPGGVPRHIRAMLSAVICATWRLYPLWPHSIAHTSCHHGGCTTNALSALRRIRLARPLFS